MVHLLMTRDQQRESEMREMADILNGMSSGLLPCYITLAARAKLWQFSNYSKCYMKPASLDDTYI